MLEVSGSLSELFRNRNGIEIPITDKICESMINRPISDKNGNAIGTITKVNIADNKWHGMIFKDEYAELHGVFGHYDSVSIAIK